MVRMMSYFKRYMAGEHEAVWAEMAVLGAAVRSSDTLEDAQAVATETMRRVLHNLLLLKERLPTCGYRFDAPLGDSPRPVVRPASAEDRALLDTLERENGPMPLSLYAFYTVVGEVDFGQDYAQLVQWPEREDGAPYTEMEMLGEFQPLSISSLSFLMSQRFSHERGVQVPLVPDEAGTAYYSGDYYYTVFPYPHADALLGEGYSGAELFVDYLRQAFRHSGFHGMPKVDAERDGERWTFPSLPCILDIARELLPM